MELNKYDTIKTIDTTTFDWTYRVRLQSMWKGLSKDKTDFWGLNMIFLDDSNCRIHAFANAKYCEDQLKEMVEGQIYIISNFKVKDFLGDETFRPVRSPKHIFFTPHTTILKDISEGLQIEDYAFDLRDMQEIEKITNDTRFLVDMLGKVQNIQPRVKSTQTQEEKYRLKFDLFDGSFIVRVTLFDQLGMEIEKELMKKDHEDIFVIVSGARAGKYDGAPNLTNYPATRIYINPDHYSVHNLKERFEKGISNEKDVDGKKLFTVKEIKNLPVDFAQEKLNCELTVKKIDEKELWFYYKCTGCETELIREQGKFRCYGDCKRLIPWPDKRFRLCTMCSDETGSIPIIFPDSEISRITSTSVIDIHASCLTEAEEEKFPDVLKQFLKQKYLITLEIKEANLKKVSTVFDATDIVHALEVTDSFDPQNQMILEDEITARTGKSIQEEENIDTPQTGKSTTNKVRVRKFIEPVNYGGNEGVTIEALKAIKKEKL